MRHAIGPYEDLITTVRKRKIRRYGHLTRPTGLAGYSTRGRRKGRQTKRWEDKYQNGQVKSWVRLFEKLGTERNREKWCVCLFLSFVKCALSI